MSCVRKRFLDDGLSETTVNIIMSSWRNSTKCKYSVYIKKWMNFCLDNNIDYIHASVYDGLKFLTHIFQNDKKFATVSCARSVLSTLIKPVNGIEFGQHQLVKKFMKGYFQLRPSLPKYSFVWDISQLFEFYRNKESNDKLDLKSLTIKTATLLSLFLCQRAQTIFTIDTQYVKFEDHAVQISFPSLLKQSRPGHHLEPAYFKSYDKDKKVCPVNLLKAYVAATKDIRNKQTKLLISYTKPYQAVTTKTISRWIKLAIKSANIDTNIFQGHSARTTAASTLKRSGANVNTILKAGGWTNEKNFAKYYNKPLQNETITSIIFSKEAR